MSQVEQVEIIHEKFQAFMVSVKFHIVELAAEIDKLERISRNETVGNGKVIMFPGKTGKRKFHEIQEIA